MCWELIFNKAGAIRGLFVHVGIIISLIIIFIEFHNGHRHHTETARLCVIQLLHLDVFRIRSWRFRSESKRSALCHLLFLSKLRLKLILFCLTSLALHANTDRISGISFN